MLTRFDEIPSMALQDIKEIKHYGQCENSIHQTVYPQHSFQRGGGGGYNNKENLGTACI